jgi:hypothetical protein
MDLKEIGCEDVDWIYLAKDKLQWRAVVNMVMNLRVLDQLSAYNFFKKDPTLWS